MKRLILLLLIVLSTFATAQPTIEKFQNSPREAFQTMIQLLGKKDYDGAMIHFDFRADGYLATKSDKIELIKKFAYILEEKFTFSLESISDQRLGKQDDSLPFYREKIVTLDGKKISYTIFLDRIRTDEGSRWMISPLTIRDTDRYYSEITNGIQGKYLPKFLLKVTLFSLSIYHYIAIIFLAVASYLLSLLLHIVWPILARVLVLNKARTKAERKQTKKLFFRPFFLFSFSTTWFLLVLQLELEPAVIAIARSAYKTAALISLAWLITKYIDWFSDSWNDSSAKTIKVKSQASILGGRQGIKILVYIIFFLIIIQNWGVNVTAIFASLGVGGIAIALAGQKTFENLFGGVMLAADKPVKVGDFCKVDNQFGTIEEIGPRSTKIRTLDRTVIVIPNGDFSQMKIENYQKRDRIRLHKLIGVTYDTTPDLMRYLLVEIRKILIEHPKVDNDPARVRFVDFNNCSLDIEIYAFILTTEWLEYLAVKEDIYLKIMELFEKCGASFAFPTQTLHLNNDSPADNEKVEMAHDQVAVWRELHSLEIPNFSQDTVERISNTAPWPPEYSSDRKRD